MRKTLLFILLISLSLSSLRAQDNPETLFDGKISLSGLGLFVDPGFQATQIAGENTGFFLFRGGLTFGDKLSLGGFYGQMTNDIRPASFENILPPRAHVDSYQAGGFIEYTLQASKMIHFTFPVAFGIIEMEVDEEGRDFDYEETKTFFVEPGAQVEINLHRFARLHAGMGYRVMAGTVEDFPGVPDAGNALTFQIGLKMGVFNINQLKNK